MHNCAKYEDSQLNHMGSETHKNNQNKCHLKTFSQSHLMFGKPKLRAWMQICLKSETSMIGCLLRSTDHTKRQ